MDRNWRKKLWDFAQLLLVPIILYLATNYLGDQAKQREKDAAKDQANQETLNSYLDVMTKLLPELKQKDTSDNARVLAKIRTLTALRTLDSERSNQLLRFLTEAKLIGEESIDSARIDFEYANLHGANLKNADLSGLDLSNSTLVGSDLSGAKLVGAKLRNADLKDAKLNNADFRNADLKDAKLNDADFRNADLTKAKLEQAIDQKIAFFCGATLPEGKKSTKGCSETRVAAATRLLVRNAPDGYVIGVLADRQAVSLTGGEQFAGGRKWSQLASGGWIASDYLSDQPLDNPI